jgi:hypothetical protein
MEEQTLVDLETCLLTLAALGLVLGTWGIVWARTSRTRGLISCGRGLFIGTIVLLGASSLLAAFHRADGLLPLGLSAGALVVGMLWEIPYPAWPE